MYSMSNGSKNGSDTEFPPVSFKSSSLGHSLDQYPEIKAVRQPQTINIYDQYSLLRDGESAETVLPLSEPMGIASTTTRNFGESNQNNVMKHGRLEMRAEFFSIHSLANTKPKMYSKRKY